MSLLDQVNKVAERLAQKDVREYLLESMKESRFLTEIKRRKIQMESRLEVEPFLVMEGPPFPDFQTIRFRNIVVIHAFTGETNPKC